MSEVALQDFCVCDFILFFSKGVVIKYLSWGGGGFLRGVCNKNAVLRRGFKQIAKKWRGMKHKL